MATQKKSAAKLKVKKTETKTETKEENKEPSREELYYDIVKPMLLNVCKGERNKLQTSESFLTILGRVSVFYEDDDIETNIIRATGYRDELKMFIDKQEKIVKDLDWKTFNEQQLCPFEAERHKFGVAPLKSDIVKYSLQEQFINVIFKTWLDNKKQLMRTHDC